MITVELTVEQVRLLSAAIKQEINAGEGTFLSNQNVSDLMDASDVLVTQLNLSKEGLMSRVEAAVEDYCDACDYTNYKQLTEEDIDYLASELQLGTQEFRDLLNLELV